MRAISVSMILAMVCAWLPAAEAADKTALSIPENWYQPLVWSKQPPVDVYRRVAAFQSALGGLQSAANSYSTAIQAQADAHNQPVLMQAELARVEAMQPKPEPRRSNFATRGTPQQIDAAARARPIQATGTIPRVSVSTPGRYYSEAQAYELGTITAGNVEANRGWAEAARDLMMAGTPK